MVTDVSEVKDALNKVLTAERSVKEVELSIDQYKNLTNLSFPAQNSELVQLRRISEHPF